MKILVIEDDKDMAGFYKLWLSCVSGDVTVTGDIDHAMSLIDEATELITLDINLSDEMRGQKTLDRIVDIKRQAPHALLIVLTGSMLPEDATLAIAAGADGFIHKSDAVRERGFLQKLGDVAKSLISKPPAKMEANLRVMEKIAERTTEYFKKSTQRLGP